MTHPPIPANTPAHTPHRVQMWFWLGARSNFLLFKVHQINCGQLPINPFLSANQGCLNRQEALSPASLCKLYSNTENNAAFSTAMIPGCLWGEAAARGVVLTLWCWCKKAEKASRGDGGGVKVNASSQHQTGCSQSTIIWCNLAPDIEGHPRVWHNLGQFGVQTVWTE